MLRSFLPPGVLEFLLLAIVVVAVVLIWRAVQSRRNFAPKAAPDEAAPRLPTERLSRVTLKRTFFHAPTGFYMAEFAVGGARFTAALADWGANKARYEDGARKETDLALYALATLAPGGVEAMKDQIRDYKENAGTPDLVRLTPLAPQTDSPPNDYVVIAKLLGAREDKLDEETPVFVYRAEVARQDNLQLVMDLAALKDGDAPPLPVPSMAHGSARLFAYLPD